MEENKEQNPETPVIDPEVMPKETAVEKRSPSVPVTIDQLAAEEKRGIAIVETRDAILVTLRKSSLAATSPSDWVLFRDPDGNVTGYLQDRGCDKIAPRWGIDVIPDGDFEKIDEDDGTFGYRIRGHAVSRLTGQSVLDMEGIRYSTDDFVKYKKGVELDTLVKKGARANLDGGCVRELTGFKSVNVQEIQEAWAGTWKKWEMCAKGRGFGSKHERAGVASTTEGTPSEVPIPPCSKCNRPMDFIRAGERDGRTWKAYWKCKDYAWDSKARVSNGHDRFDDDIYREQIAKRQAAAAQANREPGQET
ncbi:MAG: hypothetical protein GXX84_15670 [Acidobacteria bacterium]|nr:hypothetical protein [Acidobacteriota bacterium]